MTLPKGDPAREKSLARITAFIQVDVQALKKLEDKVFLVASEARDDDGVPAALTKTLIAASLDMRDAITGLEKALTLADRYKA